VQLPLPQRPEAGLCGLLAALEVLANRRHPGLLPLSSVWAFVGRHTQDYPALCQRLQRHQAADQSSTTTTSGSDEPFGALRLLEARAIDTVRPRNFRGVRSVETICRHFVEEVASPFLERAREAETAEDIRGLLREVEDQRGGLDHYLTQQAREFVNPPEGRLRAALRHECERMLEAIEAYLRERQNRASSLPRRGSREELGRELERLDRQGWTGREAAALFRRLMLESRPPELELPGQAAAVPAAIRWGLPACLRAWLALETRPAEYLNRLREDLTGNGPLD